MLGQAGTPGLPEWLLSSGSGWAPGLSQAPPGCWPRGSPPLAPVAGLAMEEEEEAIGYLDKVLEGEEDSEPGTPTSPSPGSFFLASEKVRPGPPAWGVWCVPAACALPSSAGTGRGLGHRCAPWRGSTACQAWGVWLCPVLPLFQGAQGTVREPASTAEGSGTRGHCWDPGASAARGGQGVRPHLWLHTARPGQCLAQLCLSFAPGWGGGGAGAASATDSLHSLCQVP